MKVISPGRNQSFLKNVVTTLGRQALSTLISLAFSVLVARNLGPTDNGAYALALLLPTLLVNLLNLGQGSASAYLIGAGKTTPQLAALASLILTIAASIASIIAGIIIVLALGRRSFPGVDEATLIAGVASIPATLIATNLLGVLHGLERFGRLNAILLVQPTASLICAAALFNIGSPNPTSAVIASGVGSLLATILILWQTRPFHLSGITGRAVVDQIKMSISYGLRVSSGNVVTFLNYRLNLYLVGILLSPTAAGLFIIALHWAERLWMPSQAISTVLLPKIASVHATENGRKQLTLLAVRITGLATTVLSLLLAMLARPMLSMLYGLNYVDSAHSLVWLLPGVVALACSRVFSTDLAARGVPELNFYGAIFTFLVNVIGALTLIPALGVIGAAAATSLAYFAGLFYMLVAYSRLTTSSMVQLLVPTRKEVEFILAYLCRLKGKK